MNKALALLRNIYDDDHGFKITVTEQNGNIYSKYYRFVDYLKAYKFLERASNYFVLKGDHRIYHKDVKLEIVNIYVRQIGRFSFKTRCTKYIFVVRNSIFILGHVSCGVYDFNDKYT